MFRRKYGFVLYRVYKVKYCNRIKNKRNKSLSWWSMFFVLSRSIDPISFFSFIIINNVERNKLFIQNFVSFGFFLFLVWKIAKTVQLEWINFFLRFTEKKCCSWVDSAKKLGYRKQDLLYFLELMKFRRRKMCTKVNECTLYNLCITYVRRGMQWSLSRYDGNTNANVWFQVLNNIHMM